MAMTIEIQRPLRRSVMPSFETVCLICAAALLAVAVTILLLPDPAFNWLLTRVGW